ITEDSKVFRIEPIWDEFRGNDVTIAIVGPVDRLHPDLVANYDTSTVASYDPLSDLAASPEASFLSTFLAGLAAADDNGEGIVGVAPDAAITAFLSSDPDYADITVIPGAADREAEAPDLSFASTARDGLGSFVVATAPAGTSLFGVLGSEFATGDLTTDYELHNDRLVATVVGLSSENLVSAIQTHGDMTLVATPIFTDTTSTSAFGDEIATIGPDPRGDLGLGTEGDTLGFWQLLAETNAGIEIDEAAYVVDFLGLGASGVTAGAAALMYEANPELGWRDVQEIMAYSAEPLPRTINIFGDPSGFPVEVNGAETWNGGGLQYSSDFGFGALEIFGAVRLAETWTRTSTSANEASVDAVRTTPLPAGPIFVDDEFADDPVVFTFTAPEN
ncbi:MAG: hypothetical protein AAFQ99_12110, partial [Pseudomonadota bacterium]